MTGDQFNVSLTVFFISYSVFEPLSNVLLKRLRPSVYIPLIMIAWGIVMTFMGFCTNYTGLVVARFFLGLTEAGLFPGVNYYLSCWYLRKEFGTLSSKKASLFYFRLTILGIRAAIFFSAAAISGSFGGLLAAAISKMDGIGGKPGWAWIFILEGLLTVVCGFASFWMVHDFPDTATFLSPDDRKRVHRRLTLDNQASARGEEFKMEYFYQSIKDPKTYLGSIIYMGVAGSLYAFSMFLPTIIRELGYSSTKAQLLSVPPYAAAGVFTIVIGWLADKYNRRGIFNITIPILAIIGFSILIGTTNPKLSYAATFLGALGIYPCISNTITWVSNNVEGVYKRGVTIGIVIGWGNLNGVMSSNVYRTVDAPHYRLGHGVVLGYLTVFVFGGSVAKELYLWRENKRRRQGKLDHLREGRTEEEIERLGDVRPGFYYTL